ncbi:translation initiation factor-like protein eIF-2B subunit beta [Amylocarpus encephaloides]|uniref:Translation initiation factor eIF2B subunit beta n=1 Tax=Amylocarpus encephaloides TaxID=45428 RepID=A0A9P7YPU7_9HELO|nr:translation initiation factor-like protein eIF-2B subunit beta [Amylocarpus encephaloides]
MPYLDTFLKALKTRPLEWSIENLISGLKRRQIRTTMSCVIATAELLIVVIARSKMRSAEELLIEIQEVGQRLIEAKEMVVGNIVRRFLRMIRDEADEDRNDDVRDSNFAASYAVTKGTPLQNSLFDLFSASNPPQPTDTGRSSPQDQSNINADAEALQAEAVDAGQEILDEVKQSESNIAGYAPEHILPNETILTHCHNRIVQRFLLKAAEKSKFSVIVIESHPNELNGSDDVDAAAFLKSLADAGLTVISTTDGGSWAMMPKVDRVVLAARAVGSNGGCLVSVGGPSVAGVAKFHGKPVIVLCGVHMISSADQIELESMIEHGSPESIVGNTGGLPPNHDVETILQQYLPPHRINLYITNLGGYAPSYLYRLVSDQYSSKDSNPRL